MTTIDQVIPEVIANETTDEKGLQPSILMHRNIEHENVLEYTTCWVIDGWAPKLKEYIADGWIVFRIQTEFGINGHHTIAYLAKMKTS